MDCTKGLQEERRTEAPRSGFTLVELLIVVILLGVLVAAVVPQFTDHTNDARVAAMEHDLLQLRQAIEAYYQQHGSYPGATDPATGAAPASDPSAAFLAQLTQYTDVRGVVSPIRSEIFRHGPYLRSSTLPANPFRGDNTLVADAGTSSLTADLYDGTSAWKVAVRLGKLIANDSPENARR
jgi:prepilin-type N-terminal cleavage/methylation domain-containing protein